MVVSGGVLVFGAVAAPDVSARETEPQVHPVVSNLQAFLTAIAAGSNLVDLRKVRASESHGFLQIRPMTINARRARRHAAEDAPLRGAFSTLTQPSKNRASLTSRNTPSKCQTCSKAAL